MNHLWDKFKCFSLSILSAIPSKVVNNETSHLWITPVIKRLKQRAYNKARLSHHQDDWAQYYNLKRVCQHECRRPYNNYVTSLVDDNNNVSKQMWAYVKSKRIDHCGVAPLKQDKETFTNPKDKAEILYKYFTSVFTSEDISTIPILDHNTPSISPVVIRNEGVINLLSSLKEHKAKGPDEIPTILLKRLSREISPALTQQIFRASLHQCKVPTEWKTANIVAVFNKGERSNPSNYRPVSLTCVCSKLLGY